MVRNVIAGAKSNKGAKYNKGHHTIIRNLSHGSVDHVIGVGVGHKCNKGRICSEG